jgi:hypothetical protein
MVFGGEPIASLIMCRRWHAGREGTPMLKVVHDEAELNEASGSVLDEIVREAARPGLRVSAAADKGHDRPLTRPA